MITGAHTIIYADDAEAARAFLRDVLGFPAVDAGAGWLIFALPPAELALHPGGVGHAPALPDVRRPRCDDGGARGQGRRPRIRYYEERWGRVTTIDVPGAGEVGLYESLHPQPPRPGV